MTPKEKEIIEESYMYMVLTWALGLIMGLSISMITTILIKGQGCLA